MNTTSSQSSQSSAYAAADEKVSDIEVALRNAVVARNNSLIAHLQRSLVAAIAERDAIAAR